LSLKTGRSKAHRRTEPHFYYYREYKSGIGEKVQKKEQLRERCLAVDCCLAGYLCRLIIQGAVKDIEVAELFSESLLA
jgi:hypothetical protein